MTLRPSLRSDEDEPNDALFRGSDSSYGKDLIRIVADNSLQSAAPGAKPPRRLTKARIHELLESVLTYSDIRTLSVLQKAKYLSTKQVMRLYFSDSPTERSATRRTVRHLKRLEQFGLISTFKRRIGGTRAGSSSYVWFLTEGGQRLLDTKNGIESKRRPHRYLEPSYGLMRHTLAIADCYVQLVELSRRDLSHILSTTVWEPDCWCEYKKDSRPCYLKPDLYFRIHSLGYEDSWFLEVDMGTEPIPRILNKCERYIDYFNTGLEQRNRKVFPLTLWLVPNSNRRDAVADAIREKFPKHVVMFRVACMKQFIEAITQV